MCLACNTSDKRQETRIVSEQAIAKIFFPFKKCLFSPLRLIYQRNLSRPFTNAGRRNQTSYIDGV